MNIHYHTKGPLYMQCECSGFYSFEFVYGFEEYTPLDRSAVRWYLKKKAQPPQVVHTFHPKVWWYDVKRFTINLNKGDCLYAIATDVSIFETAGSMRYADGYDYLDNQVPAYITANVENTPTTRNYNAAMELLK